MDRKFVISAIVMSVAALLAGFVVHGTVLHDDYGRLPNLFRPEQEAQGFFGFMLLAHLLIGIGLTWVYRMGRADKPWLGQGLRFGAAIAVLTTIPMYLIYYAVQPMPADLVTKQIALDTIAILILGVLVARINK
jgi:drug/metabolite transporter (DMT)-like permease